MQMKQISLMETVPERNEVFNILIFFNNTLNTF